MYEEGDKYVSNGIQNKRAQILLGALQRKPRALAVSLRSLAMANQL